MKIKEKIQELKNEKQLEKQILAELIQELEEEKAKLDYDINPESQQKCQNIKQAITITEDTIKMIEREIKKLKK